MQIQTALLPFDINKRHTREVPPGLNLKEIVDHVFPPFYGPLTAYVTINGELVPENLWASIRPKEGALVGINVVAGKGGGGKNPLATIISVVALVAAPYLAGVYAPALAASIGVSQTVASGLIRIGVGAVGFLASSALSSPPTQSNNPQSRNSSVRASPTQFIEGAGNAIDPWGVIPINLGTNRMYPKQAAIPYTETQSNSQFVRQLFCYGYGEIECSERKIGDTLISSFSDVEMVEKFDGDLSDGTSLYADDVHQENLSVTLSSADGFTVLTTEDNVDEFEIDITFLQGLFVTSNQDGRLKGQAVELEYGYSVSGAGSWTDALWYILDSKTTTIRVNKRVVLPSKARYDIRVRRTTADRTNNNTRDVATWTALRTYTHSNPFTEPSTSGLALRIRASDQLNGNVDKLNEIVSTKMLDYDADTDAWVTRTSSNPASVFRYVLQSDAFVKKLPDARINLTKLKEWHIYCESLGLSYNRVIDYETSIRDVLYDIAASGFATVHAVEGIYSVIIDNEKPIIKGVVTPRNSWGYKGTIAYPEVPHALRIEFRNKDKGYALDEVIIYSDGYSISNATIYERIEFSSCTNSDLAYIYGRRYLANMTLQPEVHSFKMDFETLTFNRGDRITLVNDSILVGVGCGRVKSLTYNEAEDEITGFVLDDTLTIPSTDTFAVRIRYSDASAPGYHLLSTVVGSTNQFTFAEPLPVEYEEKLLGALCSFVEDGKELDLIVLEITADSSDSYSVKAINYAPERFVKDNEPIPPFESNVTNPLSLYRPLAPVLAGDILSDETVMSENSDGSFITRMIIPLRNENVLGVETVIKFRRVNATQWSVPDVLSITTEEIILTGLQDGSLYDFDIYYQNRDAVGLVSPALSLRNILHEGGSAPPAQVSTFRISIHDEANAILSWTLNTERDVTHYEIRFNPVFSGATWETSLVLEEYAKQTPMPILFRSGTYFIKAVDRSGNYSETATSIITFESDGNGDTVQTLQEDSTFDGTKDNVEVDSGALILTDVMEDGYYYFDNAVDLGVKTASFISPEIVASGVFSGVGGEDVFSMPDIFQVADIFGIEPGSWFIELQMRTCPDDPTGTPTWSDWEAVSAGTYEFWGAEFRLLLRSLQTDTNVSVATLIVSVQMPTRIEKNNDVTVPDTGVTVNYNYSFQASPAVAITLQDAEEGDVIEFTSKTVGGFSFKVYNNPTSSYVERTFDFVAVGYGRS